MWKDITGFESAYEISDSGVIRSKDRMCVDSKGRKRFRKGQVLNPDIASNGYYRVTLAKDGNKLNCSIDNLEWVSAQDNTIHAYRHGLINHVRGENHPNYGKFGRDSKKAKKVKATNIITGESKIYEALIETKADGFLPSEVSRCANHGGTHHGFVFELI